MNLQPHIKRTLIQAVLIFTGILLSVMANAQYHVSFKGNVLLAGGVKQEVTMLIMDEQNSMNVELGRNGRFEFHIPVEARVTLHVSSPGFITKTITIDTNLAGRNESIIFDVELERQSTEHELGYTGPVGKVAFAKRSTGGRPVYAHVPQKKIELTLTAQR